MPAAQTYSTIATTTLGSNTNTVTFSSIASSYTDLVLVMSVKNTSGSFYDNLLRYNNDSGSNYSWTRISGNGSAATSARGSSQTSIQAGWGGTNPAATIVSVQNYSNATTYKTCLVRTNDADAVTAAYAGLWRSTATINRIDIVAFSGTDFITGSTFTLYGIAAA
jgi:hypothetical protein